MNILFYFDNLFYYFAIMTGAALVILLIFLSIYLYNKKNIVWYIVSYSLMIISYAVVYIHNFQSSTFTFYFSLVLAWLSYLSMLYFAYLLRTLNSRQAILFSILLTIPTIIKLFIVGLPAWYLFLFQGGVMALLYFLTNVKLYNIKVKSPDLMVFILSTISLFLAVTLETYRFDTHSILVNIPGKHLLFTLHFLGVAYLIFNNSQWFPSLRKIQINLMLLLYTVFLSVTSLMYFMGIYHWTRFLISIISSVIQRGIGHISNYMIGHLPLNASLALLVFGLFTILLLAGFILRSYRKQIQIQDLVDFNNKVFETASNPIIILQQDRIVRVNPSFKDLFEYNDTILSKISFSDFLMQPMPEWNRKKIHHLLLKKQDGSTIQCALQPSSFEDKSKLYTMLVVENLDRVHRELADSVFYNNILQVLITDSSWQMRLKLLFQLIRSHLSPQELYLECDTFQGREQYGMLPTRFQEQTEEFIHESRELFQVSAMEQEELWVFRFTKPDKNYGFMALVFESVSDSAGYQSQLSIVSYVVTQFLEEAYLHARLTNSEMTYKALVENSLTGIFIYQDSSIIYCNQKFLALTGYNSVTVKTLQPENLAWENTDQKYFKQKLQDALRNNSASGMASFRSVRPDGQDQWYSIYISHIIYHEEDAAICHVLDITAQVEATRQRKKLTDLLIKDQKMNTLRNLVRGIAHEFNNVFAIIKGYAELLQVSLKDQVQASEDVGTILGTIKRGMDITNRMHIFIKQENIEIKAIPVKAFFESSLASLDSILNRSGKKIQLHVELEVNNEKVLADEFSLEHVIQNLFNNSIDAIETEGDIFLRVSILEKNHLQIQVEDSGRGIPSDNVRFVFDPFYTTKEGKQGAGLGLYICHEMMDRMAGEISLESNFGKYTKVTLTLPLAQDQ